MDMLAFYGPILVTFIFIFIQVFCGVNSMAKATIFIAILFTCVTFLFFRNYDMRIIMYLVNVFFYLIAVAAKMTTSHYLKKEKRSPYSEV